MLNRRSLFGLAAVAGTVVAVPALVAGTPQPTPEPDDEGYDAGEGKVTISAPGGVHMNMLPHHDPGVKGALWINGGALMISQGKTRR